MLYIQLHSFVQVNASDSRGKADGKIEKGIGGSTSNSVKELVSNEALSLKMERLDFTFMLVSENYLLICS